MANWIITNPLFLLQIEQKDLVRIWRNNLAEASAEEENEQIKVSNKLTVISESILVHLFGSPQC